MERKIKINGKSFYVIPKRQIYSQSCTYTLCIAADPWGGCLWDEDSTPQKLLDITGNRNPESMTYCWFCSLPDKIQASMLSVNLWTDKLTEMFIPSVEEWRCVPEETRASIIPNMQTCFTRFFASNRAKKNKLICNVYYLTPTGEFSPAPRPTFYSRIIPAFYLSSGMITELFENGENAGNGKEVLSGEQKVKEDEENFETGCTKQVISAFAREDSKMRVYTFVFMVDKDVDLTNAIGCAARELIQSADYDVKQDYKTLDLITFASMASKELCLKHGFEIIEILRPGETAALHSDVRYWK